MKKLRSLFSGIHWMNHFFAFVGTCAGVLLAFFLTDYQEKRNDKDRLEKVVAQLVLEIEQNKNILKNHSDYLSKQVNAITIVKPLLRADTTILATEHQIGAIIDSFPEFFVPEKKTLVKDSLYEWKGDMNINFNMPGLSDIAWGNAQALEVLHLVDFETAYMLFSLYKFQDYLKAEANSNMELIRNIFKTSKEEGGVTKIIFNDYYRQIRILASLEENMLEAYEGNLKNLRERY
jgi:hypothetical protein